MCLAPSSMDSDLEAFSHNPTNGSFGALPFQGNPLPCLFLLFMFVFFWVHLLKLDLVGFFTACTRSSYGYASAICTLGGSAWLIGRFFYSLLVLYWMYHPLRYCWGHWFVKTIATDINASLCAFPNATSGISGDGFCSALIIYCEAWMSASLDDIFGMLNYMGNNYTISEIRSALILGIYVLFCM